MATSNVDSKAPESAAASATNNFQHGLSTDAASNKVQEEPTQAMTWGTMDDHPKHRRALDEAAMSPPVADQADTTASAVTTSKRSGKRRKRQKRRDRMQPGSTKVDDTTMVSSPGTPSKSTAKADVHDGAASSSAAADKNLKQSSGEDVTGKQLDETPAGGLPVPAVAGTTDGGQELMQEVSIQRLLMGQSPGDPSAQSPQVTDTAAHGSETDAGVRRGFDRNDQRKPKSDKFHRLSTADVYVSMANMDTSVRSPDPSAWRKPKRILNKTDVMITAVCVGTGLLFGSLVVFLVVISAHRMTSPHYCHTKDCDQHAVLLVKNLNWSLDPCEDYAAFVCSAWQPSKAHCDLARSAMDDLRFTWYDLFMDTLTRGSLTLPAGKKPLAMYEMCTRDYPKNSSQMTWVRGILEQYGVHWPETSSKDMSPLAMFVALSSKWQWSFWITVNVLRSSSSGKRRIFVSPGIYLPILRNHHSAVAQSYIKYWEQFLFLFYPDDSADRPPLNETHVNEIRIMESNIIETLYDLSMSPKKRPALFPFKDITSHVSNVSVTEWVRNFQIGLSLEPSLNEKDELIFSDASLLETLVSIMSGYSTKELNEHISWLMVQYFSIMADYSILVRHYGSQEKAELLLPVYCAHHVEASFKVLLLGLGFFARFTDRDHQTIRAGFNGLVSAAVQRIQNSHWMDDRSKKMATDKILAVKNSLWPSASLLKDGVLERIYAGFPEKEPSFAHYWVRTREAASAIHGSEEYDEAMLLLANNFPYYAEYDYVLNAAKLSIGVASPPAYYSSGTKAMLHGGLLFLMAMQLVKALDSEGIRWAANGTMTYGTILSNATLSAYLVREDCDHGAGNTSVFPELPALEVTYSAFMASRLRGHSDNLALGEKLPEEHVFFMTLCFLTCASPGARNPSAADCNKVVRNFEAFAHVYKCPKGSKMNPEKKCSFFT